MTDDNIFNFPTPKVYEKQTAKVRSMISQLYNDFTDKMEETHPQDVLLVSTWVKDWTQKALSLMSPTDAAQIVNDRAMLEMLDVSDPQLTRLLSSVLWFSLDGSRVIFADCAGDDDIVNYPAPVAVYCIGSGCTLSSQYIMFDGTFGEEASLQQLVVNKGCDKINVIDRVQDLPDKFVEHEVVEPYLLNKLCDAFYMEALTVQKGYSIQFDDNGVCLYFLYRTSDHCILQWKLFIDLDIYRISKHNSSRLAT